MRAGAPDHLSARGFWSCARRASGRSRGGRPPFCAGSRAVRLDVCGIDRHCPDHAGRAGQRVENASPHTLPAPTVEAVVNRRIRAVIGRAIAPTRARAQHVHDPADHTPIIDTVRPTSTPWQQWPNPPPLCIVQPIELLPHQGLPRFGSLESQLRPRWNLEGSVRSRGRTGPGGRVVSATSQKPD